MLLSNKHSEYKSISEGLHVFYIGFDIGDDGKLTQVKQNFYNELFDDVVSFSFGPNNVMSRIKTPQDIAKIHREALKKIYAIPEIREASDYYLNDNIVEDKYLKRGEFGELILYHFLHEYFNADALISKIYFKDSQNMAAHGFDAVHVDVNKRILWLGESKLYRDPNSAINALVKDLNEHFNINFFHDEFTIITNRVYDSNMEIDEFIKELINPETRVLDKLANINIALFAAFDSELISNGINDDFEENLQREMQYLKNRLHEKSANHPWKNHLNIFLFLFPVDSKNNLVKDLHIKLAGAQNL